MEGEVTETKEIRYDELAELPSIAQELISFAESDRILLFKGEMGAGKTTLIKAICDELGVLDATGSPTFSIVNEYGNAAGEVFYHFDFYRIKDLAEALDIGVYEYFDSGNFCFIEWPSKIADILPENFVLVDIKVLSEKERQITLSKHHG